MSTTSFEDMRRAMVVSQLRPEGVNDIRVLDAMGQVRREDYVPEDRRSTAYADRLIRYPDGRGINPPVVTAKLLDEANVRPTDHVIIVGAASGYTAAVARLLTDHVTIADVGDAIDGAFDVILIDGAVEIVPDSLMEHLAPAGRLVTGVVENGVTRLAIGRRGNPGFALMPICDAEVIVLPAFSRPPAFVF